jgi:DNA-binding transcriptional LysR family regulator
MGQSIDLNAVRVFARVVETGSFRAAARELELPKSTVSRKLAELETQLGARLLQRTTRKVAPTDVGQRYYEAIAPALAAMQEGEAWVAARRDAPSGRLKVSAPGTLAEVALPAAIASFLQRYPDVELQLDLSDRFVDLVGEGFDLAIRAGELADSSLVARKLMTSPTKIVASPKYLAVRGVPERPEELEEHEILLVGGRSEMPWPFAKGSQREVVTVKGRLAVPSPVIVHEAALHGVGIARLPSWVVEEDLREGRLTALLEEWTPPPLELHAVMPSSRLVTPALRAFVEVLVEHLALTRLAHPTRPRR